MKLPWLSVTPKPTPRSSLVSQSRQTSLVTAQCSAYSTSRIAASPAASAGAVTLKGPRTRFSTSITCSGA